MNGDTPRKDGYKWVIAALCVLIIFTALGFCSSNKDLFLKPVTAANGLARAGFALGDSIRFITTAVLSLFFSATVTRFGPKKMIVFGFFALMGHCLIYSFATTYWQFYIGSFLLGAGLAWCTTAMVGVVIGRWFTKHRGTVMGVVLASNGLGTALSAMVMKPVIDENAFGYRTAYRLVTLILAGLLLLILLFFKNAPQTAAMGEAPKKKRGRVWDGVSFDKAKKRPYFYVSILCVFLTGSCLQAIAGIKSAHLSDVGLESYVAVLASFYAVCLAGAKVLTGVSFDKLGLRITILICHAAAVISVFMLALLNGDTPLLPVFFCMVLLAVALPLETIMLPLIVSDLFGEASYTKILGIYAAVINAGYALGAPLTNLAHDLLGSYREALLVMAGIMVLVGVAFQWVLSVGERERVKTEE